jgi:thioredoxin reductase
VIGAGPVGLAAAARLSLEGEDFVVLEAGSGPGATIAEWGHVRLFTPWNYLVDDAARTLLEQAGWRAPAADDAPTGAELVEHYLSPLAATAALQPKIHYGVRVTAVGRRGLDRQRSAGRPGTSFEVRFTGPTGPGRLFARAVIDASGTWGAPNSLGAGGLEAFGEGVAADRIFYGIPDPLERHRSRYEGKRVAVVGSGHSAFNTLLDLEPLLSSGTSVEWIVRPAEMGRIWGGGANDALPARGALGSRLRSLVEKGDVRVTPGFATDEVRVRDGAVILVSIDGATAGPFDEVIAVTGFRPDLSLASELRLSLDPIVEAPTALAPLIDPNLHSCGTVPPHGHRELSHPEEGFYTVGMKSYGRAPTFLLLTGYEQVRSVVKALIGDIEAADRVELILPETGVCDSDAGQPELAVVSGADGSCCAPSCCSGG